MDFEVKNTKIIEFWPHKDERGSLFVAETMKQVPFEIKRIFFMTDLPHNASRGGHAHKAHEQVIICVSGSCSLTLDDGQRKQTLPLNDASRGVYTGSMVWTSMDHFSDNCVILVLTSHHYDERDYVRTYEEFLKITA